MTIIYPDRNHEKLDTIKGMLYESPLTIAELTCLKDLLESRLRDEWEQFLLFRIGDRERANVRHQFNVISQVLAYHQIAIIKVRPERDNGAIAWQIRHRGKQISALLTLSGTDDTWAIAPMPIGDLKRSFMTPKEARDTLEFSESSLENMLTSKGVDLEGLGGWKVAN